VSKTLVIAEKPSVAADIAKVVGAGKKGTHAYEGDTHIVSWAVGHLLEFQKPEDYNKDLQRWRLKDLPIIPEKFMLTPVRGASAQLKALKKMIRRKDVDKLVNACDAGREGELIFREIYRFADTEKPVDRLWLQSMTGDAIQKGMDTPRTQQSVQGLADAADCRAECDWLIGMNATRALTIRLRSRSDKTVWSAGRVQTATLAMLVRRERAILAHEPKAYWLLKANFTVEGKDSHEYLGTWFDPKADAPRDRIYEPEKRDRLLKLLESGPKATASETRKTSRETAPALLDLTTLQREANKRFGFSARRTLSAAQSLYEQHKLLTYPRTDSKALPEDYRPFVKQSIEFLAGQKGLADHAKRLLSDGLSNEGRNFNNKAVSDHFAIIPTGEGNASKLRGDEGKIFDLVARRFLASFHPPAEYAEVDRTTMIEEEHFRTRRKVLTTPGWRAVWDSGKDDKKPGNLPALADPKGTESSISSHEAEEKLTKPPARHTEASLLRLMETAGVEVDDETLSQVLSETGGLGTPATRADIIETLLKREYSDRCTSIAGRKALRATSRGIRLIEALERIELPRLTQPELTGDIEEALRQVERGDRAREAYMTEIKDWTTLIVDRVRDFSYDTLYDGTEALGKCPACGKAVRETLRTYSCIESGRDGDCKFIIWKEVGGRYVDRRSAIQLVNDGMTPSKAGFFTRDGREYEAKFERGDDNKIRPHSNDPGAESGAEDIEPEKVAPCPFHEDKMVWRGPQGYRCEGFEGGDCKLSLPLRLCQRDLTVEEITALIGEKRSTELLEGFISKRNRPFSATLKLSDVGRIQWDFPPRNSKAGGGQPSREFPVNPEPIAACPYHKESQVIETATHFVCKEDGCKLSVPREICKRELNRDEATKLFTDNSTDALEGFTSKAGKPFAATLYLKRSGRHGFRFQNRD
jgi:DNA topoisomerase III